MSDPEFEKRLSSLQELEEKPACHVQAAEQLAQDYPSSPRAWVELGIAYTELALYHDGRSAFRKAIRLCSPNAAWFPMFWLGHLYQEQGKLKLSERWFLKSLALNRENPDVWGFLGGNLAKQGRLDEAKSAWRALVELGTGCTDEAHLNIGLILRAEKRYESALESVEKALAIDPRYELAIEAREDLLEVMRVTP